MIVKIDSDEYYPFYFIVEDTHFYDVEVDIPAHELDFIKDAMNKFHLAQELLQKAERRSRGFND